MKKKSEKKTWKSICHQFLINSFRNALGIYDTEKMDKKFEIKPVMITPDVVRMDKESFLESMKNGEVGRQIEAANRLYK